MGWPAPRQGHTCYRHVRAYRSFLWACAGLPQFFFQVREIREPHVSYHAGSNSLASGVDADCLHQATRHQTVVLSRGDPANPSNACRSIRIRGSHSRHSCLVEVESRSQVLVGLIRVRGSVAWIGLLLNGPDAEDKGHWPRVA